jgi:hypothetical protein
MNSEKSIYETKLREKENGNGSFKNEQLRVLEMEKQKAKNSMIRKLRGLCLKGEMFGIGLQLDFLKVKKQANLPGVELTQNELIECYEIAINEAKFALKLREKS